MALHRRPAERPLPCHVWRMAGCVGVLAVAFALHAWATQRIIHAHEQRYQSLMVAASQSHPADDATPMATTVVTLSQVLFVVAGIVLVLTLWRTDAASGAKPGGAVDALTGMDPGGTTDNQQVTLLKRANARFQAANTELEQRLADRVDELESSNRELEAFSYSVSHDLRAPLRAIDGYGRILREDHEHRLDAEGRRLLGVISAETHRMGQLIDDLLTFSRLGRQSVTDSAIDMTTLAQSVFDEHAALAPGRVLELELAALPPARGDQAMLRVVFSNLIANAVKFTLRRLTARIEIGGRVEGAATIYYVKDNGVGFDMTYADKLFGVFQRLHTTEEFEGTGVGLALVQRIIHRHGGRVWADARPDAGATFYFTLPDGEGADDERTRS